MENPDSDSHAQEAIRSRISDLPLTNDVEPCLDVEIKRLTGISMAPTEDGDDGYITEYKNLISAHIFQAFWRGIARSASMCPFLFNFRVALLSQKVI